MKLGLNVQELVGGVLPVVGVADRLIEAAVQPLARGRDVLEVREHAAGFQQLEHFAVQGSLARVVEVVERKARDGRVKTPNVGQSAAHVVVKQRDPILTGELLPGRLKHRP